MKKLAVLFLLLFASHVHLMAQNRTVTGKITDSRGAPISGASVSVRETNVATQTNADGIFTINMGTGRTLVVTSVGYASKEFRITNEENVTLSLDVQSKDLNEVVVTALGISRTQKSLGYSAATLKSEEILKARET